MQEALPVQPSVAPRAERGTNEVDIMKRVFLSPAITVLLLLSVFPMIWSLAVSFSDLQRGASQTEAEQAATGGGIPIPGTNVNLTLRNYERLLADPRLHVAARNTFFFVIGGVIIQYFLGFGLALVLNQDFAGRNIVRVIFMMPMMMTPVAVAYTGRMMFDASVSPIAQLLRTLGRFFTGEPWVGAWLTDAAWAPWTVLIIDTWQWVPFTTLILLAGMQAIPDEIYEAARVDGASALQLLRRITFPILIPISVTVILIRALEIFKIIDVLVVTTGGGPGSATESLTMYIYKTALTFGNYGYAAAISYVLLVLVIVFATAFLWLARRATAGAGT